tara:strand:+ start:204 stop:380 length:177 start_codon:yes stop_codon:yes gene_type:complete
MVAPPPPAPVPEEPDMELGAALAEEGVRRQRAGRVGRGSTIVAGLLNQDTAKSKTMIS